MKKVVFTILYAIVVLAVTVFLSYKFYQHKTPTTKRGEGYNIGDNENMLVEYSSFDSMLKAINKSKDYEIVYFGRPTCLWCKRYTPIVNEYMYEIKKPILYYNPESVGKIETDSNGKIYNTNAYTKILDWIIDNSESALDKDYIKPYTKDGQEILRVYVPRYFFVKDGKILDCFMASLNVDEKGEILEGIVEEEKIIIKENFKNWLTEAMKKESQ